MKRTLLPQLILVAACVRAGNPPVAGPASANDASPTPNTTPLRLVRGGQRIVVFEFPVGEITPRTPETAAHARGVLAPMLAERFRTVAAESSLLVSPLHDRPFASDGCLEWSRAVLAGGQLGDGTCAALLAKRVNADWAIVGVFDVADDQYSVRVQLASARDRTLHRELSFRFTKYDLPLTVVRKAWNELVGP
jgi:hypothetical protein